MNSHELTGIQSTATLPSEPVFSEMRLSELRASARPVFAYFHRHGGITCNANEAAASGRTEPRVFLPPPTFHRPDGVTGPADPERFSRLSGKARAVPA